MSDVGRATWSAIVALTITVSIWTLIGGAVATPNGCCLPENGTCVENDSGLCDNVNGTFAPGMACDGNASCRPALTGCCAGGETWCTDNTSELGCLGDFVADAVCGLQGDSTAASSELDGGACETYTATPSSTPSSTPTSTSTATPTATATATATPALPDGSVCSDPAECVSNNCVDSVCCESACDGPSESCDARGSEGLCVANVAMAPVASHSGIFLVTVALLVLGAAGLRWRGGVRLP